MIIKRLPTRSFSAATVLTMLSVAPGAMCIAPLAHAAHIITFDVPGAAGGTTPVSINLEGVIAGSYADANGVYHGFLRTMAGRITSVDVPGAGTAPNNFNGTFFAGITDFGLVAGSYHDDNLVSHGFLRKPTGEIIAFDVPGSDLSPADQSGTYVSGINDFGAISGFYGDSTGTYHGFIRSPRGKFTTFDATGAGGFGTFPLGAINLEGAIAGYFTDSNYVFHGFVRAPNGHIQTFEEPGACETSLFTGCYGTSGNNINFFGTSVGAYQDNSGNFVNHAFVRTADGEVTTFDVPGAGTGLYQGTGPRQVAGINDEGTVTATYVDANNVAHGFLRTADGAITTFDAPGADLTIGAYHGTFPLALNDAGMTIGYYRDANAVPHAFLRIP